MYKYGTCAIRFSILRCLALLILAVLLPFRIIAANNSWQDVMPAGGQVSRLISGPANLYMLSGSRIYVSEDKGASWTLLVNVGVYVETLVVDPADPTHLFIGTGSMKGVMESTDGGNTWKSVGLDEPNTQYPYGIAITGLAVTSSNGETLIASTYGQGIQVTDDGGQTWQPFVGQITDDQVLGLWQDPINQQILYVNTATHGLFKSTNGGASWMKIDGGIDPTVAGDNYHNIVIDPSNTQNIYLAGYDSYHSTDGGANWVLMSNLPIASGEQYDFLIDPANSNIVYALCNVFSFITGSIVPVWKSTDGGINWSPLPNPDTSEGLNAYTGYIDPSNTSNILIGTSRGVFTTTNSGNTWFPNNTGFKNTQVQHFAIDTNSPDTLYASSRNSGILRSTDAGNNWTVRNNGILIPDILFVGLDTSTPGKLFAASEYQQIFNSIDSGANWSGYSDSTTQYPSISGIVVNPSDSNIVYAADDGLQILKSIDGGQTWYGYSNGLPTVGSNCSGCFNTLAINPAEPSILYLATYIGLYRSTDSGISWQNVTDHDIGSTKSVYDVSVDQNNPDVLYIAAENGAWKSSDGGDSWGQLGQSQSTISGYTYSIAVNPKNPKELAIGVNPGILISIDGGNTWGALDSGLPPPDGGGNQLTSQIAFDPLRNGRIFAITNDDLQVYEGAFTTNLTIAASTNTTSPTVGSTSKINFSVKNAAGLTSTNTNLSIKFSSPVLVTNADADNVGCNASGKITEIICNLGALPENSTVSGNLEYSPQGVGTIIVKFTAVSDELESSSSTTSASISIGAIAGDAGSSWGDNSSSNNSSSNNSSSNNSSSNNSSSNNSSSGGGGGGGGGITVMALCFLLITGIQRRYMQKKKLNTPLET